MSLLTRWRLARLHRLAVRRRRACYSAEAKYRKLVKRLPVGTDTGSEVCSCPALTLMSRLDPDGVLSDHRP